MTPTTLPRLGSPDVFALRNSSSQTVEAAHRHLAARRRVPLGGVTVVFEDRQTLWFRVQELSRYARRSADGGGRRELDWYERLMPADGRVRAAVWVNARGVSADASRGLVNSARLVLQSSAGHQVCGEYLSQRVTDRLIGLARWVEFEFTPADRKALADPTVTWRLSLERDGDELLGTDLAAGVVESLAEDVG